MKAEPIFIDTSFFKALIDHNDQFHPLAVKIWEEVRGSGYQLVSSNYIIDETVTLLRARAGLSAVMSFREILTNSRLIKIARVSVNDEAKGWNWIQKDWSNLSFSDCVSFSQMKRLGINKACTFDKHFSRAGFEIVGVD